MSASLVGSEMCIRDSPRGSPADDLRLLGHMQWSRASEAAIPSDSRWAGTVSYTHLTLPTICSV
eukprot:982458-Alexandrium_andersonii.AAC.1